MEKLEARIARLEAREAIQELAVRYGIAVDDRDYEAIRALFAPDGCLRTNAGVSKGDGVDAVVAYFEQHMPELGPSNHFVHGHVIEFEYDEPHRAHGVVSSHAELWRADRPMVTAMRYLDKYRKVDDHWLFQERVQTYMYFVDVREYAEALGSRLRLRASGTPQSADWPRTFT